MNWISVKDKLPDMGQPVLVSGIYEIPITAYRVAEVGGFRWVEYTNDDWVTGATHWMPLPPPE